MEQQHEMVVKEITLNLQDLEKGVKRKIPKQVILDISTEYKLNQVNNIISDNDTYDGMQMRCKAICSDKYHTLALLEEVI